MELLTPEIEEALATSRQRTGRFLFTEANRFISTKLPDLARSKRRELAKTLVKNVERKISNDNLLKL